MRPVSEILKAYAIGDHLMDEEVIALRDLYHNVVEATKTFGERYQLVRSDAVLNEAALNGFIRARGSGSCRCLMPLRSCLFWRRRGSKRSPMFGHYTRHRWWHFWNWPNGGDLLIIGYSVWHYSDCGKYRGPNSLHGFDAESSWRFYERHVGNFSTD